MNVRLSYHRLRLDVSLSARATGLSLAVIAFCLLIGLALYLFTCFCFKRICEKCKVDPGIMIWIPIVQLIPCCK